MAMNLKGYRLKLGSSSQFRRSVLENEGLVFEIEKPDLDEKAIGKRTGDVETLRELPLVLARAKRDWLLGKSCSKRERVLLVTADQVGIHCGELREKPESKAQFRKWVERYDVSCCPLEFWNGMTVTNLETGTKAEGRDSISISFRTIDAKTIREILAFKGFFQNAAGVRSEHQLWQKCIQNPEKIREDSIKSMPLGLLQKLIDEVT